MNFNGKNIGDMFLETTKKYKGNIAVELQDERLTYFELFNKALPIIEFFKLKADEHVALFMTRKIDAYCVIYACALSGKTYMPISLTASIDQIKYMLSHTKTNLVVTDKENFKRIQSIQLGSLNKIQILCYEDFMFEKRSCKFNLGSFKKSNIPRSKNAYIMFTSGTTGKPKAVAVGNQQVCHYLTEMVNKYKPSPFDRFSQVIEFTFDLSIHDIFLAWISGAALLVFNGENYFQLGKYIETMRPTFWLSVPSTGLALERARLLNKGKYSSLRVVMFCGEPLPYQLAAKWQQACPNANIENIYGPTETTIAFTTYSFNNDDNTTPKNIVPIGKPLPGLQTKIVNERLKECPRGKNGELLLSGPQVVEGYLFNLEKTNKSFVMLQDGLIWYRTGDLVFQDDNDLLHYKGRLDDQFQIRGQRVERLDLEIQFRNILKNQNIAIIPSPITNNGLVLGITLIYIKSEFLETSQLVSRCKMHFSSPFIPSDFIGIECFPLNTSGKVDYKTLKAKHQKIILDIEDNSVEAVND